MSVFDENGGNITIDKLCQHITKMIQHELDHSRVETEKKIDAIDNRLDKHEAALIAIGEHIDEYGS